MKMYCPECGAGAQYSGKQPNFCHSCGHAFVDASALETQSPQDLPEEPPIEGERSVTSFSVTKLEVDIDVGADNKPYKLGEVMGTLGSEQQTEDDFISAAPPTKEETLDSIKEESKTLRERK